MFSRQDRHVRVHLTVGVALLPLLILTLAACGGTNDGTADNAEPSGTEETSAAPRAFFAEPASGATLQAPVHLVFAPRTTLSSPPATKPSTPARATCT